jgi:hypothetical protein
MYKVTATNHDQGARNAEFVRKTLEDAERTARLMRECGYQTTITQL